MARHSGCSRAGFDVSSHRARRDEPGQRRNCPFHVQMRVRQSPGRLLLRRSTHLTAGHELRRISGSGCQFTARQSPPRPTRADLGARTRVFLTPQRPLPTVDNRLRPTPRNSPAKNLTPSVRITDHRRTERFRARPQPTRAEKESSCLPEPSRFLGILPREH